ncbi:hypothetical protein QE152_g13633 [Popillia japonica]|uniref:Uncharacterized protein n=1 Tax=Popillia japonica TaxID=7064 RepID=A0AAW1L9C0_POPJA
MVVEHVATERLVQHVGSWMCSIPTCSTDLLGWALGSIVIPNSKRAPSTVEHGGRACCDRAARPTCRIMDVLDPNMLDGFVGLGARFDSHPQLEPRAQHVGSCIDNYRTARLTRSQFSIYIVHGTLGQFKRLLCSGSRRQKSAT